MDSSQDYKLFSNQSKLDYQVKLEEDLKRKNLHLEGAKLQQLRKHLGDNLPGLLKNEQSIDNNLDQIRSFDLDDRV